MGRLSNIGLPITLRLVENRSQIERAISKALGKEIDEKILRSALLILEGVRQEVKRRIEATPEWQSMLGGELRGQLGLNFAKVRLDGVMRVWLESFTVKINKARKTGSIYKNVIVVSGIQADWSDVTSLPFSNIRSENNINVPWLFWMLTQGTKAVVRHFEVITELSPEEISRSRTGEALMRLHFKRNFRIPSEFAGTVRLNFVTRALLNIDANLQKIFQKAITSS